MANFAKPENALKRAEELINVGQKQDALQALHNVITSRRYRAWQRTHERIMFKYVELCVEMRRGRFAKDGLIQYRIVCQQVNIGSLEEVIKHFMQLATERAELARNEAQALEDALDVDDLEADKRPEDLMLSYVSGEKGKERSDRELVTPWFKFLWETYRTILEILRNNSRLEALYSMTAHRAFQFCKQYKRSTEFRRLCEIIRNHLANLNKYRDQRDRPDLTAPESLQLYLDTRFEQLKVATELELWQEAFRSIEDIYGLMCLVKRTPKPSLMVVYYAKLTEIFWISSNYLYHAYAWLKLFSLQKSFNKNLSQKDLQMIASSVALAALSVPPYDRLGCASHIELGNEKDRTSRVSCLIGFDVEPKSENREILSRSSLLTELVSKGVMTCVTQEVKDLYNLLEQETFPENLATKVQALTSKISKLGGKLSSASSVPEVQLSRYVTTIEKLATLRLLRKVSWVYKTMKIENLLKMIPFFDFEAVEKISVDAVKHGFIAMKINHITGSVLFGDQNLGSEGLRDQLSVFLDSLCNARNLIRPPRKIASKLGENLPVLAEMVEKEHKRLLARKSIIEKRKEEQERHLLEMEREEESKRLRMQKITEEAEQRRLASEYEERKKQRILKEIEERELEEARAMMQEADKRGKKKGKKPILEGEKITKQILMEITLSEQLKERQEKEKKLQKLAKTMDYLERAKREESATLIDTAFQQRLKEEATLHDHEQKMEIELSRQRHTGDLEEKKRLTQMLENKKLFEEKVGNFRRGEKERLDREHKERINEIIVSRKKERATKRMMIYYLRTEEEKLKKLQDEEEARKREEAEMKKKEEAERRAKLDEIAEKQRQRERELEEKERQRKEELLRRPSVGPAKTTEPSAPSAMGGSSSSSPGKYVPRFKREGQVSSPEPDRWGGERRPFSGRDGPGQGPLEGERRAGGADRTSQNNDKWREDRKSFGSSGTWSSSRPRGTR